MHGNFEIWAPWGGLAFLDPNPWEYALLVVYVLVALVLLFFYRNGFRKLWWRRLPIFIALLFSPKLIHHYHLVT